MPRGFASTWIATCIACAAACSSAALAVPLPAPSPAHDLAADVAAARSYINSGQSTLAVALLVPDHQTDPSNRDVAVALAQAYSYIGKQGAAIELLDAVLAKDPADGEARVLLGRAYAYNHDFADAESQFSTELKSHPDDSDAQAGLADTYTFQGRYAKAEALYRFVLAKDPKNADALTGLAAVESYTNRLGAARADYNKVLAAQPSDLDALEGLANVAYWQGDLTTAKAISARVITLAPDNSDARDLLRQIDIRVAPLADLTSATTTGNGGLLTDRQIIQRFHPNPALYFGILAARYELAGNGTSTSANRLGIVAGYSPSASARVDLRAYSSKFTSLPATTDLALDIAAAGGGNDYSGRVVVGGVDGSIRANGGIPVVNGRSASVRLTTLGLTADHRFGNTTAALSVQRATYNDGNIYHAFSADVNRTLPLNFGALLIVDVNARSAGFAQTFTYSTPNPRPPYKTIDHSHGYYDFLGQQDITYGLTYSERFNDHFAAGAQAREGTRRTNTFFGQSGPTGLFTLEPYLSFDSGRLAITLDDAVARYAGSSNSWARPYNANTLQLNVAVRL
ncbi:MAG TPA: tetratricopeptide repeat protein [Candidatus Eremiobacteraceae bacterium]|nr:tetratricopeptide repeat protein [Candidatus Eremiobacteraceae bacterium]